jgi:hypothetical protein
MKTAQIICFVFATAVATGLLPATSSYASEYQNHAGHCTGYGNCRAGHNTTIVSKSVRGNQSGASSSSASSFGSAGRPTSDGHSRSGGGALSGGHGASGRGHGSKR